MLIRDVLVGALIACSWVAQSHPVSAQCGSDCPSNGRSFVDDNAVLSPPILSGVSLGCDSEAGRVGVHGFATGATLQILVDGVPTPSQGPFNQPTADFTVDLEVGQTIQARQTLGGVSSLLSDPPSTKARPLTQGSIGT